MVDKNFIENNKEYPIAYIGQAVFDYCKFYNGVILQAEDDAELKSIIANYTGIEHLGRDLVIDVNTVGCRQFNTSLLKFLEETKLNVVLLFRYDKLDNILSSRIRKVVKYMRDPTSSMFMKCPDAYAVYEKEVGSNTDYFSKVRGMGKVSPKLYQRDKIWSSRMHDKIKKYW